MQRLWLLGISAVLAGLLALAASPAFGGNHADEPGKGPATHIVVFQQGVDPGAASADLVKKHGVTREFIYRHALIGASLIIPPPKVEEVRKDPRVAYLEPNHVVTALGGHTVPTGIRRSFAVANTNITINGYDDLRVDVDVAVIDTGIDYDHPDLNVVARTDCTKGGPSNGSCQDDSGDDGHGHGSHVAGTIGAKDNGIGVVGVAPGARLWAVKVLKNNGSGRISGVVAGIDYVTANADQIEVANMSLGCACSSSALDQAITNSVAAGVVHAVAAGNSDQDAASFSPANHDDVITVSALADFDGEPGALGSPTCRSDQDDTLADFSNWGNRIEVVAPGVCILSTYKSGGYATFSGTSMGSPHVAGAAALLASGANDPTSKADVDAIIQTIINNGNFNWTDDSGDGIQEPLLDVSKAVFSPTTVAGSEVLVTGSIEGTVTESDGTVLSGATVAVEGTALSATTDAFGKYSIADVPEATHDVIASADGFSSQAQSVTVSSTAIADFALATMTTGAISGKVTNIEGGADIANTTVSVDTGEWTTTAADGTYTIADVPTGDRSVTASADGFQSQTEPATVTESQTTTVDFGLTAVAVYHVSSMALSVDKKGRWYNLAATMTIKDAGGALAPDDVTVTGTISRVGRTFNYSATMKNGEVKFKLKTQWTETKYTVQVADVDDAAGSTFDSSPGEPCKWIIIHADATWAEDVC